MTPMPSVSAAQPNLNFRQQEAWNLQVMQCMMGFYKQNVQNVQQNMQQNMHQNMHQNMPAQMTNPVPGFMAMGNHGIAFGPFPNPWMGEGFGISLPGFQGAKVYAIPADQMQQAMGWGFPMNHQEMTAPKADWSPNGQSGFGYQANWEPEMPEAFKDFVEKALDCRACWDLQDYIPDCSTAELKFMAHQLRGHVREVVESPHGNHVLQCMLEFMAPKALHFVLDELLAWAPAPVLARHRYGCRVLERILEHFGEASIKPLLEDLLYHAKELCQHPFGNFVMQIFMEHAPATYRKSLIEIIAQNMVQVASDHNGCAVLEKGLSYGEEAERKMLVKSILKVEGLLPSMKSLRGGATAIDRVLDIATGWALSEAQRQLNGGAAKMINKGRGRWRAQESGRPRRK
mmetsp:Transcript_22445/g.49156  ORF Transcript_22445/g.49156 Transcript_22445/m.49156 type:complete len:401 (-) Transcript_22445:63-1265(-)